MSAPAPAADPAGTVRNPFVGPRAYGRDDRLYGRDGETEDLLDLIVAERVVLLYSPSGAGKTSLVQARLVPRLESDGFRVHPIVRTATHDVRALPVVEGPAPNRYVLSTLLSLEETLPVGEQRPIAELAGLTIARYLAEAPRQADAPENAVLIFDQFEEVLTTSPTDRPAKREFFTQVGAALQDRSMWALFVIREDFLAELDPYARLIPTRFANRYRLDLLEKPAALDAVTLASRDSGVTFQADAAAKLVDDLRRIRVQHLGTVSEEKGPYVEPVQLQVVCRQLWERLGPGVRTIEEADVEGVGDVNQALATYYGESMTATAATTGTDEAVLRDWVDQELITAQGFRAQTLYGPHHDPGPDDAVLGALIDTHLLRSEPRRGAVWYELAHDRLVEPIQNDNSNWRGEHLSELEQRASLWDGQGRGDDLLVTGPALAEAEAALRRQGNQPSPRVHNFLEMSRRRQQDAERMERAQRRTTRWLIVAVVGCMAAVLACVLALESRWDAKMQAERADAAVLFSSASGVAGRNPDLGLTLAVRAAGLSDNNAAVQDQLQSLLDTNRVLLPLLADGPDPRAVDMSEDGRFMATANENGTVRVWDHDGRLVTTLEAGPGTWSVSFGGPPGGPDGPAIAAGSLKGVTVWSSLTDTAPRVITSSAASSLVYAVALSPDGQRVAVGDVGGNVVVYDSGTMDEIVRMRRPDAPGTSWIPDVGWTPDEKIAAIDSEGHLVLWDPAAPATPLRDIPAHSKGNALDVSNDGKTVATSGDDGAALWDLATGRELHRAPAYSGASWDVDLSRDGTRMLVVDYGGYLRPYDTATGLALFANPDYGPRRIAARLDPMDPDRAVVASYDSSAAVIDVSAGHSESPMALDVGPDGTVVTAAGDNGTLRLWSPDGRLTGTVDTGPTGITDAALSADGRFVATLDESGHAAVHALRGGTSPYLLPGEGVTAVAISADGRFVATADTMYAVTVADTTGQIAPRVSTPHQATVSGLTFGPTADAVAAVYDDDVAAWWTGDGPPKTVHLDGSPQDRTPYKIVWSGDVIATAGRSNVPEVWNARTGVRLHELKGHTQPVYDIAFDRGGQHLATVSDDRDVVVWDVSTGRGTSRRTFSSWGRQVAFAPDGTRVYIVGQRGAPYVGYLDRTELLTVARAHVARDITPEECERYLGSAESCGGG